MATIRTHYDNLQVARNASPEVVRAAYKGLSQKYHPDRNPNDRQACERRMKLINKAFEVLSDPLKRAEHDAWITRAEAAAAVQPAGAAHSSTGDADASRAWRDSRYSRGDANVGGSHRHADTAGSTSSGNASASTRGSPSPPQPASPDTKTILKVFGSTGLFLVIVFSGGIGKFVGKTAMDNYYSGKKEGLIDEVLLRTASELNSRLPMMVDSDTRLDSTTGTNNTFRYNYTLVNYASSTISASELTSAIGQTLVNKVCTSKDTESFLRSGVTVSFAYFGNDGKQIALLSVAPSECARSLQAQRRTPPTQSTTSNQNPTVNAPRVLRESVEPSQGLRNSMSTAYGPSQLTPEQLLREASTAVRENRLVAPAGNNALEYYLTLLHKQPHNATARDALDELFPFLTNSVEQIVNSGTIDEATRVMNLLAEADPSIYTLTILRNKLDARPRGIGRHSVGERGTTPTAAALLKRTNYTRAAEMLHAAAPDYPSDAVRARLEGWVEVEFTVMPNGSVAEATVVNAAPTGVFDTASLQAVARWTFRPRLENGSQ
jgi:protein TonB